MSDSAHDKNSAHDEPDEQNTQGTPDGASGSDADTASGGAPAEPETTDPQGMPVDNPSGG
jgi:hypothetical protein